MFSVGLQHFSYSVPCLNIYNELIFFFLFSESTEVAHSANIVHCTFMLDNRTISIPIEVFLFKNGQRFECGRREGTHITVW